MKKIYKSLLGIALSLGVFTSANAQTGNFAANYGFQSSTGVYTALTTPTVLTSGATMDDAVSTVTLSAPLSINGSTYTTVFVSENGYLAFGGAVPSSYTPLSAATNSFVISPFGRDNGGIDATSEMSWADLPQEIVFQWKNITRYNVLGEVLNFQVRINKPTGVLGFIYGSCTPGASAVYPQVGIKGSTTTWANNVNNLTIANTTGNCSWASASTGSVNSSTMYFNTANTAISPTSGLVYAWVPSTLTPPVRTIAAVSAIGSNSVVLNFTQPAGTPSGYNVQYRVTNSCAWTNAGGNPYAAAATITVTGLNASTSYEYRIQSIFITGDAIFSHNPASFITLCGGTPTSGSTTASSTLVCTAQNVTLGLVGNVAAGGLTYQWQSSPNGVTYTPIPSATLTTRTESVTAATYYQCVVACGSNTIASVPVFVNFGVIPSSGNTVSSSTLICSNPTAALSLTNASVGSGLTYQWQSSPTGTGYTSVSGATLATTAQTVTSGIFFQNLLTCGTATATSAPVQISIAPTTTNSVPYFEGFEGIGSAGQLPNCSWLPTGDWTTFIGTTPTYPASPNTGTKFAYTRWSTITGGDIMYSNGLQLNAGVTYSASVAYAVSAGSTAFDELNMLVGPNQSSVSAVSIASLAAVSNSVYATLTNTFTVATSGIYYLGFRVVAPTTSPDHIGIDDISVTAPCSLNTPTMSVSSSTTAICSGQSLTLMAMGSSISTYTWNTTANTMSISVTPTASVTYTAIGTSALNCTVSATSPAITVNALPIVGASSSNTIICAGQTVTLTATGAPTFSWSNSATGASISVSPTSSLVYTVIGTDANGCMNMATVTQSVSTCTGIQNLTVSNTVNMYPNPNEGLVTITLSADLAKGTIVNIYDALGKLVLTQTLTNEVNTVNTSSLNSGVYMYSVINNSTSVKTGRMIKN